uniref:THIOREDOXIN 1 n=1 Tax=Escherichia coli TaxID=562 RepID=UPI0000234247|nr:Chain A, Thioredoxin 1 [Escherichia coli]1OAZ_B Chain B, Thioredoxin 1 [Escherichia coli]
MSDKIIHLTDDSFDTDVLKADGAILVDFWAEWCGPIEESDDRRYDLVGPCKMIAPILDEIADEYQGKLTVAKLNIDQNPGTAPKYGIRGIPTLLLFKNGEVAATKVGALSKGQLKEFLDANLA